MDQSNKKNKIKSSLSVMLASFRREFMKTSAIGKKLLTAGRTNAHLKDTYESLGRLIEAKIDRGEINIDDSKVRAHLHTIKACKKDLKELEHQVNRIKFAPSPQDISQEISQELKKEEEK